MKKGITHENIQYLKQEMHEMSDTMWPNLISDKIDKQTAAGIAKSIKKKLVERQVLEINQNQLEETLFETIT